METSGQILRRAREAAGLTQDQLAVRAGTGQAAEYVTKAIGARPVDAAARERWDAAARTIEAYVAQHRGERELALAPPELADRSARGAWERMARAIRAAGIEPPSLGQERDTGFELDR
jgi:transcriptional regulator with XRE-family HTH domain